MSKYKKIENYFKTFNFWTYFILLLCLLGVFRNIVFLKHLSFLNTHLVSVFLSMIALYACQIFLILLKHWSVWVISLVQIFFCMYIYPDFSIVPFSAVLQFLFFEGLKESSFAWAHFINFMFISLGLSAEIIKTYLLYIYFPRNKNKTAK